MVIHDTDLGVLTLSKPFLNFPGGFVLTYEYELDAPNSGV